MIYFLDFEASSLMPGSYPVEIAWVEAVSGTHESYVIRPSAEWTARDGVLWSDDSERTHGISRETLRDIGLPHDQVARRAHEVLGKPGGVVVSDAPGWDGGWLDRLLKAAGIKSRVRLTGFHEMYGMTCRHAVNTVMPTSLDDIAHGFVVDRAAATLTDAKEAEAKLARNRHRALPDALAMRDVWRRASENFEAHLQAANLQSSQPDTQQTLWP